MKTTTLSVGTQIKIDVQSYGIKIATIDACDVDDQGVPFYSVSWRNTPWSQGGTFVSPDEILEVVSTNKEAGK